MALAVLPYPSIDFVPLDVLTADELDQIIANQNAINAVSLPTKVSDLTNDSGFVESSKLDYSTSEVDTGTKWIDGKKIYAKTIKITSPTIDATTDYAHGISGFSFGWIQEMFVVRTDNNSVRSLNFAYSTSASAMAQLNPTNLSYRIPATDWNWATAPLNLYAVIKYTKS